MPGAEPMKVGVAVSDLVTGLYSAIAILAALLHQARTGEGQIHRHGAVRLPGRGARQSGDELSGGGMVPERLGNAHPNIAPYQVFATADGFIILAAANDGQFRRFAAAVGHASWADDDRFATNAARVSNREFWRHN